MPEIQNEQRLLRRSPGYGVRIRRKEEAAVIDGGFLMHYGISGQKWGIRRFQNEDRTLTEAGKERYSKTGTEERKKARAEKKAQKQAAKEERRAVKEAAKPESSRWKPSEAKYLSDEELNRRNSRLQREKQYVDMTTPQWKKNVKRGAIGVIAALTTVPLAGIATDAIRKVYRGEFNKFVAPWLGQKVGVPAELKIK